MKKLFSMIALIVLLLSTVSAHTDVDFRIARGMKAPHFKVLNNSGTSVSPTAMTGQYVIVNFWSSTDADSRIAANLYDNFVEHSSKSGISLVSINVDKDGMLTNEVVRRDGLNVGNQYKVESSDAIDMIRRNNLDRGLNSYLVDPSGRIVAVNPTVATIRHILK